MNENGYQGQNGPYQPGNGAYQPGNNGTYQPGGYGTYQPGNNGTYQPGNNGAYQSGGYGTYQPGNNGTYQSGGYGTYQPGGGAYQPGGSGQGPEFSCGGGSIPPEPKKKKWIPLAAGGVVLAAVVVLGIIFVPRLFADPKERVLDAFRELPGSASSPIAEEIGWADMQEAMGEAGHLSGEFSIRELPASMGADAQMLSAFSFRFDGALDSGAKAGELGLGLQMGGMDLVSGELYFDEDMLAVSLPQFYDGALAIGTGNLREQLEGWPLFEQLNLSEYELAMLDVTLEFFPDSSVQEEMQAALEESLQAFQDEIVVEELDQTEEVEIGGRDEECRGYLVSVPRDAVIGLLEDYLDWYQDLMDQMGLTADEYTSLMAQLDAGVQQIETVLQAELEAEAYLTGSGELAMVRVEDFRDWIAEDYQENMDSLALELSFHGEAMPGDSFDLELYSPESGQSMRLEKTGEVDQGDLYTEYRFSIDEGDGEVELLSMEGSYLVDSREFSYRAEIPAGNVSFFLEGSLGDVQRGESLEVIIDEAGLTAEGETLSIEGSLELGAGAEGLAAPEDVRMFFDMDEQDLLDLQEEINSSLGGLFGSMY